MATLIAVYNSEGCVGRCDARCYGAHKAHCHCVCHGANHGAGLRQARANTEELAERWVEECQRQRPSEFLFFERPGVQMEFPFE